MTRDEILDTVRLCEEIGGRLQAAEPGSGKRSQSSTAAAGGRAGQRLPRRAARFY